MRVIRVGLFIIALLIMTELSFRVYIYGLKSIIPARMNSYTQIFNSGMLQRAAIPEVNYVLKPNLDTWYKGNRFSTNSDGLRGREISIEKPAGVRRVAVLGASWTMGSGVANDEIWHTQLESIINSKSTDEENTQYEFINFGIDQYGVGEILANLEKRVPKYDPDLIIVALTYYTPVVLWEDPPPLYEEKPKRNPLFDIHSLRLLDMRMGTGWFNDEDSRRKTLKDSDNSAGQLKRALQGMNQFSEQTGIPVVVVKLAYQRGWAQNRQNSDHFGDAVRSSGNNLIYADLGERIRSAGYKPAQLRISVWDSHPNPLCHKLIAEAVHEVLIENNLLDINGSISKGSVTESENIVY